MYLLHERFEFGVFGCQSVDVRNESTILIWDLEIGIPRIKTCHFLSSMMKVQCCGSAMPE
jgi:hypothetical protein